MTGRILVAGVGNVFLGDDGFGVAVAQRLATENVPAGADVADFGIRGVHLAYELLDGYDAVIMVDAVPRGHEPGTLVLIEPDLGRLEPAAPGAVGPMMDAHQMNPDTVLGLVKALGGELNRIVVVGCEPADVAERMELSGPVAAAVEPAVALVHELLGEALSAPAGRADAAGNSKEAGHVQAMQGGGAGDPGGDARHDRAVPERNTALHQDPADVSGLRSAAPSSP